MRAKTQCPQFSSPLFLWLELLLRGQRTIKRQRGPLCRYTEGAEVSALGSCLEELHFRRNRIVNVDVAMSPEAAGLSLNQKPSERILSSVHESVILANRVIDVEMSEASQPVSRLW
jgi:hypothetical protein